MRSQLGYSLSSNYQVLLDPDEPRTASCATGGPQVMGPDKHLGYAVQWFAFAARQSWRDLRLALNLKKQIDEALMRRSFY